MNNNISIPAKEKHLHPHPIVFMFLTLPFGILSGYFGITFGFLYKEAGISMEAIATIVGMSLIPNYLKFLWAPLVDIYFSLKKWYIVPCILSAVGILIAGILPIKESNLTLLYVIIFIANIAMTFVGIATNALAAHGMPDEIKARVGGYSQVGNLGGNSLGGGVGLLLAKHFSNVWVSPTVLALTCLLCCFGLFFVKEPEVTIQAEKLMKTLSNLFKDIWITIKTKLGFLAIFLCFLPFNTGAAQNLFSAVAEDWKTNADMVALVTGGVATIITAAGCLFGGWICDRMNRQRVYIILGVTQVICALGMAYCPHTEIMYIAWTSVYAFTIAMAYSGFSAFVFEAIGKGAAATKYTVYACLSNFPAWYMIKFEGLTYTKYGPSSMLNTEAICGVIGIILFLILAKIVNSRKQAI